MKTKFVLALTLLTTLSTSAFCREGGWPQGSLGDEHMQRSCSIKQFSASFASYITPEKELVVLFSPGTGLAYATVKNSGGAIVVKRTVNTAIDDSLQLNISILPKGLYTITFFTKEGTMLKAERFRVD